MFLSKQTNEILCISKDGNDYFYAAECIFVKNGEKQIWRYEASRKLDTKEENIQFSRIK